MVDIVGYPDARLGEKACAFVTSKPSHNFMLEDMSLFPSTHQVTRQYHPERLELVQDMPKTPSGKLQKFKLREMAIAFGNAA